MSAALVATVVLPKTGHPEVARGRRLLDGRAVAGGTR